jgi:sulfotransferase 6B1
VSGGDGVGVSAVRLLNRHAAVKRRVVVPVYRRVARTVAFYPPPRVCAISFPKAGTHLLSSLLGHLPRMMFSGLHMDLNMYLPSSSLEADWAGVDGGSVRRKLGSVRPGHYMTAHFPALPELSDALREMEFATLLIVRDPRDLVVSAAHYIASDPSHHLYRRLAPLPFPERLTSLITGFPADSLAPALPSIGVRLAQYQAWLVDPQVCAVRFEDLVGPAGAGTRAAQLAMTKRIAEWVGRPLDDDRAQRVAEKVWSPRSSTFREGRSGGWRDAFSDEHRRVFDREAGEVTEAFGYVR